MEGGGRCTVCLPNDVLAKDIGHCIQELACCSIQCYSSEGNWKIPKIPAHAMILQDYMPVGLGGSVGSVEPPHPSKLVPLAQAGAGSASFRLP